MSKGIQISPKYGVNSSICKCFWCHKDMGIALCGKLPGDEKAPEFIVQDYDEPCNECAENFKKGILIIGCTDKPISEGMPSICRDASGKAYYPDGSHVVMTENGMHAISDSQEFIDSALKARRAYLPADFVNQLVEDFNKLYKEEREDDRGESGVPEDNGTEPDEED